MTEIGKFHHKCEILEIKDGGRKCHELENVIKNAKFCKSMMVVVAAFLH